MIPAAEQSSRVECGEQDEEKEKRLCEARETHSRPIHQ